MPEDISTASAPLSSAPSAASFPGVPAVAAGYALFGADFYPEAEVAADRGAHRGAELARKARAVFGASAVFVGAFVEDGREELREQEAVGSVQLDAVRAAFLHAQRRGREFAAHARHVVRGHRAALDIAARQSYAARREPRGFGEGRVQSAAGMAELDNQLRAALVYRVGEAADFADASVAVEPPLARRGASFAADVGEFRDDRPSSSRGGLGGARDGGLRQLARLVSAAAEPRRGADEAVARGESAAFKVFEKSVDFFSLRCEGHFSVPFGARSKGRALRHINSTSLAASSSESPACAARRFYAEAPVAREARHFAGAAHATARADFRARACAPRPPRVSARRARDGAAPAATSAASDSVS